MPQLPISRHLGHCVVLEDFSERDIRPSSIRAHFGRSKYCPQELQPAIHSSQLR